MYLVSIQTNYHWSDSMLTSDGSGSNRCISELLLKLPYAPIVKIVQVTKIRLILSRFDLNENVSVE